MKDLAFQVAQTIRDRQLFSLGERILVAVSGGLDSMVLLHLLDRLATPQQWTLTVAHFNHQLRGAESEADEALVRQTAEKLGWAFVAGRANVKRRQKQAKESLEMAARALRHEFLAKTATQLAISSIALAHHADDQVELFFLRLLRGAGTAGLAGMKWIGRSPNAPDIRLVRPLLWISKEELSRYACQAHIPYREDSTNRDIDMLRNRLRLDLIPRLKTRYQAASARKILQFMEGFQADSQFIAAVASEWLEAENRPEWPELALAVQRQAIIQQLIKLGIEPEYELVENLRLAPGERHTVSPGRTVSRDAAGEICEHLAKAYPFQRDSVKVIFTGSKGMASCGSLQMEWELTPISAENRRIRLAQFKRPSAAQEPALNSRPSQGDQGIEYFDADKVGAGVIMRHWQPGDRYQPIGMDKPVKLQNLFVNQKIPRSKRIQIMIGVTEQGAIFWVEGCRISDLFKLDKGSQRCLKWQWHRKM